MKKTKIDLVNSDPGNDQTRSSSVKGGEKTSPGEAIDSGRKIKLTRRLLFLCGIVGFVFLTGAIGAAGYLGYVSIPGFSPRLSSQLSNSKKSAPSPSEPSEVGPTVKLNPLTINLREEAGRNYLKTTIVLEIGKKDSVEEVKSRMSTLTDTVILTLCDKRMEDLRRPESKEQLKQELLVKMNQYLNSNKIKRIYFDEFLYQ